MAVLDIETVKIIESSVIERYKETIEKLGEENKKLREELGDVKEQLAEQKGSNSLVSVKEFEELKRNLHSLTELVSLLRSRPEEEEVQYDLRNEFDEKILFGKSRLKLDWVSNPITAKIIEAALKKPLEEQKGRKLIGGFDRYKFPPRAIDVVLNLREWTIPNRPELWEEEGYIPKIDITNFKVTDSLEVNNSFIPWEPVENQVALATGVGKSTFFLRCTAHCNGGATLVVPYGSLVGSVLSAHNKWLSQGKDVKRNDETGEIEDDPEKRVTRCQICRKKHTAELDEMGKAINPYVTKGLKEINETGPDCMINVFTWWEFLDIYLNKPELIKPWVVFDEAHTDLPAYRALIAALEKMPRNRRPGEFGMVQMSATFGNRPTSKKLTGNITDYYVTNFSKFLDPNCKVRVKVKDPKTGKEREEELKSQPDFFKKKVIVFCDDFKEIDFKVLKENNIKYIKLDESLKDYATDIVRETSAPVLIFANRDYSVGFSFGDVNVISAGVSRRKIIVDEKGTEKIVGDGKDDKNKEKGKSDFADLLQERGRAARDINHKAAWVSLIPENGKYVLQGDYWGTTIENYFKSPNDDLKKKVMSVISLASQGKKPEPLSEEAGRLNLHKLLVADLREQLNDPNKKLFNVLPSEKKVEKKEDEKYVRSRGEYIFKSPLAKYFKKEYLSDILISATEAKIDELARLGNYPWYETEEQDDDFIFSDIGHIEPFGFYFQARANCEVLEDKIRPEDKNKELRLKFKTYTIQGKKGKLKLKNKD